MKDKYYNIAVIIRDDSRQCVFTKNISLNLKVHFISHL